MKILYVGHLNLGQTSLMRMRALKRLGFDIVEFNVRSFLDRQSLFERQVIKRFSPKLATRAINRSLLTLANQAKPDIVWFDKPEHFDAETLTDLKALGARLIYYTPDPYFTVAWKQTAQAKAAFDLFDVHVTAKSYEINQFMDQSPHAVYMPLGFCDEVHRPTDSMQASERFPVSFVGGWEPRRERLMEALATAGITPKIWGYGWDHLIDGKWTWRRRLRMHRLAPNESVKIRKSERLHEHIHANEVYHTEYASVLSRSQISVGFLRTTWPDQHTTRTFEIPACGSVLVADRSQEHCDMFQEGTEAEFFDSEEELIDKVKFLIRNPETCEQLANAGRERCKRSGYSYIERYRSALSDLGLTV